MEWKEIGKILKIKWEDVIFFFLSAQSEHISTPITKPVKAQCSTGNFHEESQKKKVMWKNWSISPGQPDLHPKKVRSVDSGFAVLISFGSGCILLNEVCNIHIYIYKKHVKQIFY